MTTTYDGTTTTVPASSSPQTLSTVNDMRGGLVITNTSSMTMYVLLGQGIVSTTLFTYSVPTQKSLEVVYDYVGLVTGIWPQNVADGGANVTVLI